MKFKPMYSKQEYTVEEFTSAQLDGSLYEQGIVEDVKSQSGKTVKALGRLLQVLADKNLLSRAEIHHIITGYEE